MRLAAVQAFHGRYAIATVAQSLVVALQEENFPRSAS
jgi:hypothetical protein